MTCQQCETPCTGALCKQCELELAHGTPEMPDSAGETWAVAQQGLGDAKASGQTTLSGGIRKERGDDDDV